MGRNKKRRYDREIWHDCKIAQKSARYCAICETLIGDFELTTFDHGVELHLFCYLRAWDLLNCRDHFSIQSEEALAAWPAVRAQVRQEYVTISEGGSV